MQSIIWCNLQELFCLDLFYRNIVTHLVFNFFPPLHQEVLSDLNKENYELYHEQLSIFVCDLEAEIEDVNTFLHSIRTENSSNFFSLFN